MAIIEPIPYSRQNINKDDIEAVTAVLKDDFITQGPKIAEFEKAFTDYIGVQYAVAVSNGTAALHLSAISLGVKPSDKVITTPITFAATANCVRYSGGEVVFADIDEETYLLDLNEVEKLLKASPKRTYKGIIPVDFTGRSVNLESFRNLADEYGCWILEDACHAPGGYFIDKTGSKQNCGNGIFADLAIFSFHPVKHIAAGEGGMITTNNKNLYEKLLLYRNHGITKSPSLLEKNLGEWYYEMHVLGYNYRLSDIHAALGISQLNRAGEGLERRNEIANKYTEAFSEYNIITPKVNTDFYHAYHLYVILIKKRDALYKFLKDNNINSQIHYIPVHLQPYYKNLGWKKGDLPKAESYYENVLSLPMFPSLSNKEVDYVISKVQEFLNNNL